MKKKLAFIILFVFIFSARYVYAGSESGTSETHSYSCNSDFNTFTITSTISISGIDSSTKITSIAVSGILKHPSPDKVTIALLNVPIITGLTKAQGSTETPFGRSGLSSFNEKSVNGDWKLNVFGAGCGLLFTPSIKNWTITINYEIPTPPPPPTREDCENTNYDPCDNPSDTIACSNNGEGFCCPSGYPYYCDKTQYCTTSETSCNNDFKPCGGTFTNCPAPNTFTCDSEDAPHCCASGSIYCENSGTCLPTEFSCNDYKPCGGTFTYCSAPDTFTCDSTDAPRCCSSGSIYCEKDGVCSTSQAICDKQLLCNGYLQICADLTEVGNCSNDTVRCCPSDNPFYCEKNSSCTLSASTCDRGEVCGGILQYCEDTTEVGTCYGNDQYKCCPQETPNFCEKNLTCLSDNDKWQCDQLVKCDADWEFCPQTEVTTCDSNKQIQCCPQESPNFCEKNLTCLSDADEWQCDQLMQCDTEWEFCAEGAVGTCNSNKELLCCPSNMPFYCESENLCYSNENYCDYISKPDIIINQFFEPSSLVPNEYTEITAIIQSTTSALFSNFTASLYIDSNWVQDFQMPGHSDPTYPYLYYVTFNISNGLSEGLHSIALYVDSNENIDEMNENNNMDGRYFYWGGDLSTPLNLVATPGNVDNSISLNWEIPQTNSDVAYYSIYEYLDDGTFKETSFDYDTITLLPGYFNSKEYCFTVTAIYLIEGVYVQSDFSNITCTFPSTGGNVPSTPILSLNLVANSNNFINLNWTQSVYSDNPNISYRIYRTTNYSDVSDIYYDMGFPIKTDALSYKDSFLSNENTYYYRVTAVSSNGEKSQLSNMVSSKPGNTNRPGAPYNLSASANNGNINIWWMPPSNNFSDIKWYNVYRGETSINLSYYDFTSSDEFEYVDINATNDIPYYYAVTSEDSYGNESDFSNIATATSSTTDNPPAQVTGLYLASHENGFSLSWNRNYDNDLKGYNIYRSTISNSYTNVPINPSPITDNYYFDNITTSETIYYYTVRAVDNAGTPSSSASNEVSGIIKSNILTLISPTTNDPALIELNDTSQTQYPASGYNHAVITYNLLPNYLDFYPGGVKLEINIEDSFGRVVYKYEELSPRGGTSVFAWNGRDSNGNVVPAGYYSTRAMIFSAPSVGVASALAVAGNLVNKVEEIKETNNIVGVEIVATVAAQGSGGFEKLKPNRYWTSVTGSTTLMITVKPEDIASKLEIVDSDGLFNISKVLLDGSILITIESKKSTYDSHEDNTRDESNILINYNDGGNSRTILTIEAFIIKPRKINLSVFIVEDTMPYMGKLYKSNRTTEEVSALIHKAFKDYLKGPLNLSASSIVPMNFKPDWPGAPAMASNLIFFRNNVL